MASRMRPFNKNSSIQLLVSHSLCPSKVTVVSPRVSYEYCWILENDLLMQPTRNHGWVQEAYALYAAHCHWPQTVPTHVGANTREPKADIYNVTDGDV